MKMYGSNVTESEHPVVNHSSFLLSEKLNLQSSQLENPGACGHERSHHLSASLATQGSLCVPVPLVVELVHREIKIQIMSRLLGHAHVEHIEPM
jgi:hypothetical protein